MKIVDFDRHRNGSSGNPFQVVRFEDEGREMLAVVFEEEGSVAVLRLDGELGLDSRCIGFTHNSWRGDHYEAALRQALG